VVSDQELDVQYGPSTLVAVDPREGGIPAVPTPVRQEWRRWTSIRWEPGNEVLSRPGADWKYAEGPEDVQGKDVLGPVAQFLERSTVVYTWHQVPRYGLFSLGGEGPPNNIIAGLGNVNATAFPDDNGFPPGTLLLDGVRFTEQEAPHYRSVNALDVNAPRIVYTVEFFFTRRDPPPFGVNRGWNLVPRAPYREWFLITNDGTFLGAKLLNQYEFKTLWTPQP
jgi:hypothetical protein